MEYRVGGACGTQKEWGRREILREKRLPGIFRLVWGNIK